jgi:hypothetical protein
MSSGSRIRAPERTCSANPSTSPKSLREIRREEIRAGKIYDEQLVYSREQVMRMLGGVSYDTVCRLEDAGNLRRVQFNTGKLIPGKSTTKVLYRREDVLSLIEASTTPMKS